MKSIKWKIVLVSCLICIFSILSSTILNYRSMSNVIKDQTMNNLEEISRRHTLDIEGWLDAQILLFQEVYNDIGYREIYNYEDLISFFEYKNKNNKEIEEYYLALPENALITDKEVWKAVDGYQVEKRDWYKEALTNKDIHVSLPYKDVHNGKVIITLSKRIDKDGKLFGVLCSDISINYILDLINRSKPSLKGYSFLVDKNKNILAHPNKKFLYNSKSGLTNIEETFKENKNTSATNDKEIYRITDYDGIEKYIFYSNLEDVGFKMGLVIPIEEVMRPIDVIYKNAIRLALVIILISISLTVKLGNSISKPILSATNYIEKMSKLDIKGEIDQKYLNRKDEIGRMYIAFQKIIYVLRDFLNRLARMVKEIMVFSTELFNLSESSHFNMDNINSDLLNIVETELNQKKYAVNTLDLINNLIDSKSKNNKEKIYSDLGKIKLEIEKENSLFEFRNNLLLRTIKTVEQQKGSMDKIESASECLKELGRELDEYINKFQFK